MTEIKEYEQRIAKAKKKRERLSQKKAEKLALLNNAKERLKTLQEKAEKQGFSLNELDDKITSKRELLNGKIAVFESSLEEADEALSKYDD